MNIFVLDTDPILAAQMQCDKHVPKMIVETAQMLSTAHHVLADGTGLYKPTHVNHPCSTWVRECSGNYFWAWQHLCGLLIEFKFRFNKSHTTKRLVQPLSISPCVDGDRRGFATACGTGINRATDSVAVDLYRWYYHTKAFAAWQRGRPAPYWWMTSQ